MSEFIPASWRHAAEPLRDDLHDAVERWWPGGRRQEEVQQWPPSVLTAGGPRLDVEETDDEIIVEAELPGLEPDDFNVELTGQRLVIRGEIKRASEKRQRDYIYTERSRGAFARAVTLPCEVNPDQSTARYRNGALRLTLPKTEQAKAARKKIKIQT